MWLIMHAQLLAVQGYANCSDTVVTCPPQNYKRSPLRFTIFLNFVDKKAKKIKPVAVPPG